MSIQNSTILKKDMEEVGKEVFATISLIESVQSIYSQRQKNESSVKAMAFLMGLYEMCSTHKDLYFTPTTVNYTSDNKVFFEWSYKNIKLTISVENDKIIYTKIDNNTTHGSFNDLTNDEYLLLFKSLFEKDEEEK